MKTTLSKDQKTAFWRQHIELASQYPDGIPSYCVANGLVNQTFYKWRHTLSSKTKKMPARLMTTSRFAEVRVCKPEVVRKQGLPDAKWLADFVLHLTESAR